MADKGLMVKALRIIVTWMSGACCCNHKRSLGPPDSSNGPEEGVLGTSDVLMRIFLYCTPDPDWI